MASIKATNEFHPVIDGTWKNFITHYGADPAGSAATNTAAVNAWLADTSATKLYIPATGAAVYDFSTDATGFITNGKSTAIISAWGARVSKLGVGPLEPIPQNQTNSARINSVSAGAFSVTVKNAANVGRFSAGARVLVCGLATQLGGYPPNWHFFEYKQVLSVVGSVVTFTEPLRHSYLDSWPDINGTGGDGGGTGTDPGGPAMLYAMHPAWDTTVRIYGLHTTFPTQIKVGGRDILMVGCTYDGDGPYASVGQTIEYRGGNFGLQNEVDKLVEVLTYRQMTGRQLDLQSSSIERMYLENVAMQTLAGTAKETYISRNTRITNFVKMGPTSSGAGTIMDARDSYIASSHLAAPRLLTSTLTFSGGTFSVLKSNPTAYHVLECAIPGLKWAMCFYGGGAPDLYPTLGGGPVSFTILAFRADATTYYVDTDIVGALPTPLYQGASPPNYYINFAATTVTQINSGPADLTGYAAP